MSAKKLRPKKPPAAGFGERLQTLRRQKKLSQSELGELASIHYTHIGRYERGSSLPTAGALHRLAEALGVSGDFLMEGSTEEVARLRFKDRDLLSKFQEVEKLPDADKELVLRFLEAFILKCRLQGMLKAG